MKAIVLPILVACLAATPALAGGDTLLVRLNADIRSLDPGTNRDGNTDLVQTHLFEGLVAFKEDATVGPLLAKSVDVSPDGRTYTFVLRDGLKFSNGEPVTSADVLFDWKRYTDPDTGWRCLTEVDGRGAVKVADVTAKDDKTVVFTLEKPSALFLGTLARPDCGGTGIYHRSSLGRDGKWVTPVTTAPYKLGEWKRGQYIELLRNDHYVSLPGDRDGLTGNKTVAIPKLRFLVIPDESTAKAALLTGDIDLNYDVENADVAEYQSTPDLVTDTSPTMNISDFLFQTNDPLLSDVRIRKAFLLSLDMPELVGQVTSGQSQPNNSPIPPASAFHKAPQSVIVQRDIPAAKTLLAEAGYDGRPIKMITNKRYQPMFDQAILAQAMAQEAGLNIELEVIDWATQQDRYLAGNYQIMSHGFSARLDPSLSFEMFSGDKTKQPRKVWDNPEAAKLLAASMETSDIAQRQALLDKLEALYRDDVAMITLYSGVRTGAARANVVGYKGWALGTPRAWGVSFKP
ncbi:peptide/nickel transport system substrate-binding protein [Inquilinus ginsengisoli]|uniref:Peptide/nickel transport system substrate-binding protein n=1 Tax=Inquilinus ginsengisoli TaxID=363840 RepID=A0ABU1JY66_9PROT|nr:ABC transporter substrate-binding protein [Inquilinus ginsengisoli]MDR6293243.1 peptide/nickel transport system substrate-binding protein [Inquilinus ginsengisoli]